MAVKKKKRNLFTTVSVVMVMAVIGMLSCVMWIQGQELQDKIDRYDAKIAEYQLLIEEENERTAELEERKRYVQTKKYIEEIAHEKFGLLYEYEIMFKPEEK